LDALKALGASPATKLVVPAEFTSLLRPLIEHTNVANAPIVVPNAPTVTQHATDGASAATAANGATP
jgi:hypothetical protein